ncbi:MAG: WD40 repeat domain-containing protein [Treponema sp.]|jgi:hypothetical protein|nr:WD40 repeat domain-containing protein [Treponema sp.]
MKTTGSLRRYLGALSLLLTALELGAQPGENEFPEAVLPGGHRGAVNVLVYDGGDQILSAGEDGFLTVWDLRHNAAADRFQVSPYGLRSMVLRPGKAQVALVESDGLGFYRISAWDYQLKQKLFTLRFRDSVSYINYSAGGNFLIVARNGRTGVVFVHPETGEILNSPAGLTGLVGFAATGKSERTMISYFPSGILSYWNLESETEMRRFAAPANMSSPILFGNNRFFGGIDPQGLVILDAVSGAMMFRDRIISPQALFASKPEEAEFFCLSSEYGFLVLSVFHINSVGEPEIKNRIRVSPESNSVTCATGAGEIAVLGTAGGGIWTIDRDGISQSMATGNQRRLREAAASRSVLVFLDGDNSLGVMPRDYRLLKDHDIIRLERGGMYTQITSNSEKGEDFSEQFLFWRKDHAQIFPILRTAGGEILPLDQLPLDFPLISAALMGEEALFLDSIGNITVLSAKTGVPLFSFSSLSSLDAAFLDRGNIIIGQSAISGNTPFLALNVITGETLPIAYPSDIGARVYHGLSGAVYGAVIEQDAEGNAKTSIVRLDPLNPALSVRLVEYEGEDTLFSIAESGGVLATTLGGDGAILYLPEGETSPFERSPGLPVRLIGEEDYFIILDEEGNITWHNPQSGKLLALFRLYEDSWILEKPGELPLRGSVVFDRAL